jgi:hypothetical protein
MEITVRDIDILRWILEQTVMTEEQIRKIFWKDKLKDDREAYRRLNKLKKAGYLKMNTTGLYRSAIYLVTAKGIKELKRSYPNTTFGELSHTTYSKIHHDLVITDLRILFHELGYTHWISRRILQKEGKLRRIPDAMIYNNGKYIAIEYGLSKKSKRLCRKIFIDYHVGCSEINEVIYVVNTPELAQRFIKYARIYGKLHFVTLEDIQKNKMNASILGNSDDGSLRNVPSECSLYELLWRVSPRP